MLVSFRWLKGADYPTITQAASSQKKHLQY